MESNEFKDSFYVTYTLQGSSIPFDIENNKVKDLKYIKALAEVLNNNEYFKNAFTYDDLMNEIYNKTSYSIKGIDKVVPSENIPGVDKVGVFINQNTGGLGFKITFISPAIVEGQTER